MDYVSFEGNSTRCYYGNPVEETYNFNHIDPTTGGSYRISVSYKFNEDVADAIENKLLRAPEYSEWSEKLNILKPMYSSRLKAVTYDQLFTTATGLSFRTLHDGQLTWTIFEATSELPAWIPLENITTDLPKVSITELSDFDSFVGFAYSVNYRDERYALKFHGDSIQDSAFPAQLNAQLVIGNIPHVQGITAIVTEEKASDNTLYIVGMLMKFCQKGDLKVLLSNREPDVDWDRKTKWASQITHGVMGIHEAGIVHGDLRCANVVVDENDDAQIIDIIGRYGYAEGWACMIDDRSDPRRDVYSLGVTLWEMAANGAAPVHPLKPLGMETFDNIVKLSVVEDVSQRVGLDEILHLLGGKAICGCLANR